MVGAHHGFSSAMDTLLKVQIGIFRTYSLVRPSHSSVLARPGRESVPSFDRWMALEALLDLGTHLRMQPCRAAYIISHENLHRTHRITSGLNLIFDGVTADLASRNCKKVCDWRLLG